MAWNHSFPLRNPLIPSQLFFLSQLWLRHVVGKQPGMEMASGSLQRDYQVDNFPQDQRHISKEVVRWCLQSNYRWKWYQTSNSSPSFAGLSSTTLTSSFMYMLETIFSNLQTNVFDYILEKLKKKHSSFLSSTAIFVDVLPLQEETEYLDRIVIN